SSVEVRAPQRPFEIRRGGHVANSNLGNGNVYTLPIAALETEICGQRLWTACATNEPRGRSERLSRRTAAAVSRGNVLLFCAGGNHVNLRGLPGGAEGIRTPDL